jgi:PAS domain S-box-containing protein
MQWQINPYIFPMLLSAILASLLALLAWRRRPVPGATTMTALMLVLTVWSILYAFELAAVDLTAKLFWARLQYAAFLFVPILWLVFVLQYTNQEKMLSRRGIVLLAIIPLVTLALVWTTERHGLIYRSVSLDTSQGFSLLVLDYGEAFWIQGVYNYFLFLFATAIAFRTFLQSPPLQRAQMGILLIAAMVPLIGNILYVTKLTPWPHLDLGPVLVTFSGLLGVWGLFRYGFLDIMPVARDALIEGMTDSVIVIDTQHRILDLNTTAQRLIGLTRATAVGQQAAGLIPQWNQVVNRLPRAGTLRLELEPDEQLTGCHLDAQISPLYERSDRLRGWLLVLRDISDRKRAEREQREQTAMTSALRDSISALTTTLSLDEVLDRILAEVVAVGPSDSSDIMLIEDGVARIVRSKGYVERGKKDWVVHARLPVMETANLRSMAETGQPIAIADTHLDLDWVRFPDVEWLRSYAGAPIVSKGQVIGFLNLDSMTPGFFTQEHAQRLQAFASQAGIAIENARLYSSLQEANAQLRVALQAKEEMTQNVSHELRTPLTLIMGYVELMETSQLGALNEAQSHALRVMHQQVRRLHFMVNSLLALQTFNPDKLHLEALDLATWLPTTANAWQIEAAERGLKLCIQVPEAPFLILAGPSYLELVIGNLLDNAVKFSPEGGHILLRTSPQNGKAMITVADQGIGIPSDKLSQIFDRFYQVDGSTTRRFGGIGIGLALCQTIIAAHGGTIEASSLGLDQGTTFTVWLPIAEE